MGHLTRYLGKISLIWGTFLVFPATVLAADAGVQYCNNNAGILTGLGCIPVDPVAFISKILSIGLGIGGGLAFLMILLGAFQIQMSSGNPERLNTGKEMVESAISGLLLIIFSVFILRLIGVNILGLPGFG